MLVRGPCPERCPQPCRSDPAVPHQPRRSQPQRRRIRARTRQS